jgi:3-deoxy-7-phosphoheptulonate synthase
VGADGIMIEVHPHPENALSDGPQSLRPDNFRLLMEEINAITSSLKTIKAREKKTAYK